MSFDRRRAVDYFGLFFIGSLVALSPSDDVRIVTSKLGGQVVQEIWVRAGDPYLSVTATSGPAIKSDYGVWSVNCDPLRLVWVTNYFR